MSALVSIDNLTVQFRGDRGWSTAVDDVSFDIAGGRERRRRRGIRQRQERDGALDSSLARARRGALSLRRDALRRARSAARAGARPARRARPRHCDGVSGPDVVAQPGADDLRPDLRTASAAPGSLARLRRAAERSNCSISFAFPTRRAGSTNIRIACRAACASA